MPLPETIGRYQIQDELGHGAMGSVYRANDPIMDRTVAIKTILSSALSGPQATEYRERFIREARAAGRLAHPGVVTVYDVGEAEGVPYLVMEFLNGRTLADAMEAGQRFAFDRIYEIGYQVADALGYAHRNGVVHRDIKPANILLASGAPGEPERAKIMDLGVAKLNASQITTTGQLLGTPAFMPPEQFTGAPLDGRADLFSLGVILYWMATGDKPFSGDTITAVSYKIVHSDPAPPRKINPAVPAPLEQIIMRCLEKDPARRYPTGEALAADLASARAGRELAQITTTASRSAIVHTKPIPEFDGDPNTTLDSDLRHAKAPAANLSPARHADPIEMSGFDQLAVAHAQDKAANANRARQRRMMFSAAGFAFVCVLLIIFGYLHHRSEVAAQAAAKQQSQVSQEMQAALNPQDNSQSTTPASSTSADQSASSSAATPAPSTPDSSTPSTAWSVAGTPSTQSSSGQPAPSSKSAAMPSKQSSKSQTSRHTSSTSPQQSQQVAAAQATEPVPQPAAAAPTPPQQPVSQPVEQPAAPAAQPANSSALPPPAPKPTGAALNDAAKLHVDDGHVPINVSFVVLIDGKILVGRPANLEGGQDPLRDDQPIAAGTHEFKVITAPGGLAVGASNTVREDLKSKKKKTLRVELRDSASGQILKKSSKVDPNSTVFVIELRDSGLFGIR
jgi:serine/threonine protein kinase